MVVVLEVKNLFSFGVIQKIQVALSNGNELIGWDMQKPGGICPCSLVWKAKALAHRA